MGWLDDEIAETRQGQVDAERARLQSKPKNGEITSANLSEIKKQYPWLTAGAAMSLAKAGQQANSRVVKAAARLAGERKKKKGFGWHSFGDAVGGVADFVTPEKVEDAIGYGIGGITKGVKPVVRGIATVAQGGADAIGSAARDRGNVSVTEEMKARVEGREVDTGGVHYGKPDRAGTNTLVQAVGDLVGGRKVDLGEGFFPAGDIRERVHKAQVKEAYIADPKADGGKSAATFGRMVAVSVTEPGSQAYSRLSGILDAGIAIGVDPVDKVLGVIGAANRARKLIDPEAAGLLKGLRKTVITERANEYMAGPDGRKFLEWAAGKTSPAEIFKTMGGKISAEEAARLSELDTVQDVADYMLPLLGTSIREKPYLANALTRGVKPVDGFSEYVPDVVKNRLDGVRMLHSMPGHHVDPHDATDVAVNLQRFAQNAKLGPEKADEYFNMAAKARGPIGQFNVVNEVMGDAARSLLDPTTGKSTAKQLTRLYKTHLDEITKYYTDDIGMNAPVLGAILKGNDTFLPTPHMWTEYVNRSIPLPDARALRRATSQYGRLLNKATLEGASRPVPVAMLDFVFQDVWKPMQLLRGAWTVRVVGEEQIRMAASGLTSAINHPLRHMAWITGRRGGSDVLGEGFDALDDASQFNRALSLRGDGWRDRVRAVGRVSVQRGSDDFVPGWANELAAMHNDPIVRRVAGGLGPGDGMRAPVTGNAVVDVKEWFWSGAGQKFRKEMAEAKGRELLATSRETADELIDTYWKRIQTKTAGNVELIDAIGDGRLNGVDAFKRGKKGIEPTGDLAARLDELNVGGASPTTVLTDINVRTRAGGAAADTGVDRAVDTMFNTLMSRPTNYLSRSPAFRQYYWRRMDELMPSLDAAAQAKMVANARLAKLDAATLSRLERQAGNTVGDLTLKEADLWAKAHALDGTKKLLYDLSEKSQFFDITRHFFPFGEAWKEVLTVWGKIGTERPDALRKGQIAINGAIGAGWFHEDDRGELVFNYPATGWLTKKLAGVPAPFTGRVAGLNVFSENPFMPGVGPAVQLPASVILKGKPSSDAIKKMILPFGDPDIGGGIVESFLPPWLQKFRQAQNVGPKQDDRLYANTVMEAARFLNNTGDYDTEEELMAAAQKSASILYAMRGAIQFFAPSAPSPQFQAHDKDGRMMTSIVLTEKYKELVDKDVKNGTDAATSTFLATYGTDALLYMQGKSKGSGGPMSAEGAAWAQKNKGFAKRYKETYGFFAPQSDEFDYDAYSRLIKNGEIRPLPFDEWYALAQHRVGAMVYRQAQAAVGDKPTDDQQEWLRGVKEKLRDVYPGYDSLPYDDKKVGRQIRELRDAVNENNVKGLPVTEGIRMYLGARDQAIAEAKRRGLAGFGKANAAEDLRGWLRNGASVLSRRYAGFDEVFNRVFNQEMTDDKEVDDGA